MKALYDLPAPAKLNLFLHVTGRRADGYHELQSVFVPIDWCDTLHLECRRDGRLVRHDLGAALPEDDLCLRAARALQQASGTTLGVDIAIDKQIPWGAGLGGGSSDAATTLLALNRLWGLRWPRDRLAALAVRLGADVPFFLGEKAAWVEGIGERLTPVDLPAMAFAVVKPQASLPTAEIFSSHLLKRDTAPATLSVFLAETATQQAKQQEAGEGKSPQGAFRSPGFGRNDLQPAAEAICSEVAEVAAWLRERFGNSRMTGSGSAVFARTGTGDLAGGGLTELPPGWQGRLCRSLELLPLWGWASG